MDADTSDATAGVGDSLNGETKPDPAKLAQTAIIKQDVMLSGISTQSPVSSVFTMPSVSMSTVCMPTVTMPTISMSAAPSHQYSNHIRHKDVMLSGTSTQSPVSSVLTMPTVSMPAVSMSTGSLATTLGTASLTSHSTLPDSLFLPAVPSINNDVVPTSADTKPDVSDWQWAVKGAVSQASQALSGQPQQLLGQPQVAPQFIVASQPVQGQGGTTAMTMQQLLIPVSTGNGTQQLISIPVSLAAGAGGQIQLLTTSNGQLLATNLANLAQPVNLGQLTNTGAPAAQSSTTRSQASSHILAATPQQHATTSPTQAAAAAASATAQATAGLPQLITNAQGQIVAIGAPQVLPQSVAVSPSTSASSLNQALTVNHTSSGAPPSLNTPQPITHAVQVTQANHPHGAGSPVTQGVQQLVTGTNSVTVQPQVVQVSQPATSTITSNVTPNINQLLPNTVSNSTESTTVDGINLDEIKEFAKQFKIRRLSLGLTQTQVGQALSATEGPSYSQSAICRFEKLDITPKSAQKIKPVLERWMLEAEERYKNGVQNLTDFIGSEPSKKRKRRTSFTPQALEVLNEHFERNTHPSGAEMTELSGKLNYDREVIRVWFCNKRQALKNTIKKLKAQDHVS